MENLLPPKDIIQQRIADMATLRLQDIIKNNQNANFDDLFPFAYEKEYELFKEIFDLLLAFIKGLGDNFTSYKQIDIEPFRSLLEEYLPELKEKLIALAVANDFKRATKAHNDKKILYLSFGGLLGGLLSWMSIGRSFFLFIGIFVGGYLGYYLWNYFQPEKVIERLRNN